MKFFFRLGLITVISASATISVSLIAFFSTQQLVSSTEEVTKTYEMIGDLDRLISTLKDAETGQRGYVITGDRAFLEPYDLAVATIFEQAEDLQQESIDDSDLYERITRISALANAKMGEAANVIAAKRRGDDALAQKIISDGYPKRLMDEIRREIDSIVDIQLDLLEARQGNTQKFITFAVLSSVASGLISLLVLTYGFYLTSDEIQRRKTAEAKLEDALARLKYSIASSSDEIRGYIERGEEKDRILASLERLVDGK